MGIIFSLYKAIIILWSAGFATFSQAQSLSTFEEKVFQDLKEEFGEELTLKDFYLLKSQFPYPARTTTSTLGDALTLKRTWGDSLRMKDLILLTRERFSLDQVAQIRRTWPDLKNLNHILLLKKQGMPPSAILSLKKHWPKELTLLRLLKTIGTGLDPEFASEFKALFPSSSFEAMMNLNSFNCDINFVRKLIHDRKWKGLNPGNLLELYKEWGKAAERKMAEILPLYKGRDFHELLSRIKTKKILDLFGLMVNRTQVNSPQINCSTVQDPFDFSTYPSRQVLPYDADKAKKESGLFVKQRTLSDALDVYIHQNKSYLVWKKGPQQGHIYKVMERRKNMEFSPQSLAPFVQKLEESLKTYASSKSSDEELFKISEDFSSFLMDFFESKQGNVNLREAQFYAFPDKDETIIDLYLQMQNLGINNWVKTYAKKVLLAPIILKEREQEQIDHPQLAKAYNHLLEYVEHLGKDPDEFFLFHDQVFEQNKMGHDAYSRAVPLEDLSLSQEELIRFQSLGANLEKVHFLKTVSNFTPYMIDSYQSLEKQKAPPLYLTHGTFSDKFPQIIQLGGLWSSAMAESVGIFKRSGGEMGGSHSPDPFTVSFWHDPQGEAEVRLGYGAKTAFEYPITFAVGDGHYKNPDCYNIKQGTQNGPRQGAMGKEGVVSMFFPLSCIDYIFVPPFAIPEITESLKEYHLGHIQILPYAAQTSEE